MRYEKKTGLSVTLVSYLCCRFVAVRFTPQKSANSSPPCFCPLFDGPFSQSHFFMYEKISASAGNGASSQSSWHPWPQNLPVCGESAVDETFARHHTIGGVPIARDPCGQGTFRCQFSRLQALRWPFSTLWGPVA